MTVLYLDCPKCGETEGVEVSADVDLGLVDSHKVTDASALLCIECGADPDDAWDYEELKRRTLTRFLETYDDGS